MCKLDTLAARINYAMEKRDMQQADIARATGLSTAVVSQIISGKTKNPTFDNVCKIAFSLNVSLDFLAGLAPKAEWSANADSR